MEHGGTYGIWLRNHTDERNDVIISIDGKEIGGWRLGSFVTATIERPPDDTGKFTFYEIGSSESQKAGLDSIARDDLGLVKVTFIPEHRVKSHAIPMLELKSYSRVKGTGQSVELGMKARGAGGTGLSGRSDQEFGSARAIDRDYDRQVVINLRLVTKPSDEPRPLRASATSNLVPPPVN